MARVTLTVQLMHAQQRIAVLERELHEANERCAQLEAVSAERDKLAAQLDNAEAYIHSREGNIRSVPQGELVREYTNSDGVRMGKFKIGFNRYAHRPLEAQHA